MKKIVCIVLCLLMTLPIFAGCKSDGLPKGVSEEAYSIGLQVIKIADKYLDMEMERKEARDRIDNLRNKINEDSSEYEEDKIIATYCLLISSNLTNEDYADVLRERNFVAKILGEKKRK